MANFIADDENVVLVTASYYGKNAEGKRAALQSTVVVESLDNAIQIAIKDAKYTSFFLTNLLIGNGSAGWELCKPERSRTYYIGSVLEINELLSMLKNKNPAVFSRAKEISERIGEANNTRYFVQFRGANSFAALHAGGIVLNEKGEKICEFDDVRRKPTFYGPQPIRPTRTGTTQGSGFTLIDFKSGRIISPEDLNGPNG